MKQFFLFLFLGFTLSNCVKNTQETPSTSNTNTQIEDILNSLSLEEKVGQLNLIPVGEKTLSEEHIQMIKDGKVGSIIKSNGAKRNLEIQKVAVEESKSGIPILFQEDVIHGYKTIAPTPLAEAASWDLEAIKNSAAVAAREAAASGIHLTYAPMVDISRDPRWGRILEAAGEDPYYGSLVAAARVKGFQEGNTEAYQNILSCVKHFVGYGASLGGMDYNIQDFSERELREIHLPPFQAAFDAGVASLMCAYTAYDGVPLTANKFLLQDVLREEMGFKGLIMTDWETIPNLVKIGVAENDTIATQMAIETGIDIDMTSQKFVSILPELVKKGIVSEKAVDNAVRQVLLLKQKAGLFDDPYLYFNEAREKEEVLSERNLAETKEITQKSLVLLKNEKNTLPINQSVKNIAVIGPFAKATRDLMGWWSMMGNPKNVETIYDGIEKEFGDKANINYAPGCAIDSFRIAGKELIPTAVNTAKQADVVILVLGEAFWMSGEGGGTASLHLPSVQEELATAISKTGTPVITLIATGKPYILTDIAEHSDALMQIWMPGTTSGSAVAEVLSGKVNPSGKLPITFPYHEGQIPIFYNRKKTSHTFDAGPKSSRYSTTYRDVQNTPLYPFGYGLSYTTFEYSDIQLDKTSMGIDESIKATITVKNTGKFDGREITQLYIRDKVCSVTRPLKELKDFKSVNLKAGEAKELIFEITKEQLTFINREYKTDIELGAFDLFIGPNSSDLKQTTFELK